MPDDRHDLAAFQSSKASESRHRVTAVFCDRDHCDRMSQGRGHVHGGYKYKETLRLLKMQTL